MNQRPSLLLLVAVIISFAGGFLLRPLIDPAPPTAANGGSSASATTPSAPRATVYFAAHLEEARKLVATCRDGVVRGAECANANVAVVDAEGRERARKFIGNTRS